MELKAGVVLNDCHQAWHLLMMDTSPDSFRIHWVAAVALARAVGHVLVKVDAPKGPIWKGAIDKAYARWKSNREGNAIFWEFIEEERNNVLKEYSANVSTDPTHVVLGGTKCLIDDLLFCGMLDGRFAGQDCRDVLQQAIDWWENELESIAGEIRGSVDENL